MKALFALAALGVAAVGIGYALHMPDEMAKAETQPLEPAAIAEGSGPVVVEMFTSQSCSSCPPADALAAELAVRDDVIVISRNVTYWNRIGWEDTLSDEANTQLQRAYARRGLAGRNGVYTPQAVVDGRDGVVGSRASELSALIAQEGERERPLLVVEGNGVSITGATSGAATLSVIAVDASETVAIGAGENRDRSVTYTNSWLGEAAIGTWNGGTARFQLPETLPAGDRHVLILREASEDGSGAILAGRWIS
ncbi:DUF1223 domain-containing protein [Erythrobacter sp. EC-HK427]|uniref:DUF1223 domain-containing protein n=1 Tax=Erythrobacter sp. EC-HK427 TaxID=2038396 RepID=UPI001254D653|nr:DUF1223 domain-containing protein [Erythrobacter sp. EC-HK427]VVT02579.1 conserved hypothetical protein [Erythrobacter sp. EC-HK427]